MSPVNVKESSPEEREADAKSQAEKEAEVGKSLLDDLDLTAEVEANVARGNRELVTEKADEEKNEETEEAEEKAEETAEETADGADNETEETESEADSKEDADDSDAGDEKDDEELIPKSKVNKRFAQLTAELKAEKAKNAELSAKMTEASDPDTAKLNAMSQEQLKATRKAVAIAIVKEHDDAKLEKLLELQDKVETALSSAPTRFESSQIAEYDKVADRIAESGEIPINDKTATELKAIAVEIYRSQPELQGMVKGQAIALNLAFQHYKAILSKSAGKEKVDELKRTNNKLKAKTSLDSSGVKAKSSKEGVVAKLREKALDSKSSNDRLSFIKEDPRFNLDGMIPDDFKDR
jgi:hypothetical protein